MPVAGASEVLELLTAKLGFVGVVSGRPLRFLVGQLGSVPGLSLFGLYGLERSTSGTGLAAERAQDVPAWEAEMARLALEAESEAPSGVEVERKGVSMALHVRRRPEALSWALAWARDKAAASGLIAQPGRLSVELLPPGAADGKARVVEEVASALEALCFVGDDVGDLPAFEAVRRLRAAGKAGVAVGVASPEQPVGLAEAVDLLVDGPTGVVALLRAVAQGSG